VFKDDERIRAGELWLDHLQEAVGGCGAFVVLVGRDGVRRWIGAETQVALNRYFAPHDDALRLPIFPILLEGTEAETLPAFLRLFQMTPWNGADALPERLLDDIRDRTIVTNKEAAFEGCPFVGLAAYSPKQAHLFFGRHKETLDALACFNTRRGVPTVRWLEINGNSGSGKSSLMNAGLLPLIDQGWLWPRTGFARWMRVGPMMPGEHPVEMLAEHLARTFEAKMGEVCSDLQAGDSAVRYWLRGRKPGEEAAFLLAIDQFEELFTFSDPEERRRFDGLLAAALEDPDCPLFVISTVRADFLDRFEDLPRLVAARNRLARPWTLAPIGEDGLREVIEGPALLTGLDVGEVKEAMVAEARDETGALPLVENALHWLWEKRAGNRLSGHLFTDQGGLAGILSGSADGLLAGLDKHQRERALDLLFRLVRIDPEARRHTRRRIPLAEAIDVAGGGERGRALVDRLAGQRRRDGGTAEGPLRLITVTGEAGKDKTTQGEGRWVNLIHETLIRSKGVDPAGKPKPYWPTLWAYVEQHKEQAARRERLRLMAREWKERKGLARLFGLLPGWSALFGFRGLAAPRSIEQRYLRWSRASALVKGMFVMAPVMALIFTGSLLLLMLAMPLAVKLGMVELVFPALVTIPAGSFMMGGNRNSHEQPVHPVTFSQSFDLGRTEVTFSEWVACAEDGGCSWSFYDAGWGLQARPVIYVSWNDAQAYVGWLSRKTGRSCRLPSEAEWEYAARAGTTTEYALPAPGGSNDIGGKGLANCRNCGFSEWDARQTAPVASFPANAWGVHDMHGNVAEWVEDCAHETYVGAPEDGRAWLEGEGGDCSMRMLRGGSSFVDQEGVGSALRSANYPDAREAGIGFRVVCSFPSLGPEH
jgi:formylglycine-generating enzyme required for sulfatase activity